jgi:three-Cys-motif partner protein
MTRQRFGGPHTEQKLAALEKYLQSYAQALKKQPFRIAFFDAFAGTGKIELPSTDAPLLGEVDAQRFCDQQSHFDCRVYGSVRKLTRFP